MISGKPKAAGKTTFLLQLIRAVTTGEPFLGTVPERVGPAVLLSEEGAISLTQGLRRARMAESDSLHILRYSPGRIWSDVARQAITKARDLGAVILAIDTLPLWAQIPGDAENSAGIARDVFDPFTGVDDLALLLAFHDRKSGGEPGEAARGSSAFAGAVDIIVDITRVGGNGQERRRELSMIGRFEIPDKLIIELGDDGYRLLGSAEEVHGDDVKRAIRQVLDGRRLTEGKLVEELSDFRKTIIGTSLRSLVRSGEVDREGDGKRGSPFRYCVSPTVPPYSAGETIPVRSNGHLKDFAQRELGLRVVGQVSQT